MLLVIVVFVCIVLTISIALFVGSSDMILFDFRDFNFANALPIFIIGGFISCTIVVITLLFLLWAIYLKVKDYFSKAKIKGDDET